VYEISCPREGSYSSKDGLDFSFRFLNESNSYMITVGISRTALSSTESEDVRAIAMLRAAKKSREEQNNKIDLTTGNFETFSKDAFAGKPDKDLRSVIKEYILERYDNVFDKPFSVVEIVIGVESTIERVVKALHYLHKHEMISFDWAPDIWQDGIDKSQWLIQEFAVNNNNLENLKRGSKRVIQPYLQTYTDIKTKEYDFFICHASEDKKDVAEPLEKELKEKGAKVWLDKGVLTVGDRLLQKINEGMINSKYGIVIISPDFFKKDWPQIELAGLVQKEINGEKVILPVWHNVDYEMVKSKSPILADRLASNTKEGIPHVANDMLIAARMSSENNVDNSITKTDQSEVADIAVDFYKTKSEADKHIYGLKLAVKLKKPPDQLRLRLHLNWPCVIPVVKVSGLEQYDRSIDDGVLRERIYELNWESRIFPGQVKEIIGVRSPYQLQYEFNDEVLNEVDNNEVFLGYTLYFEDHLPIPGSKSFKELNVF